MTVKINTLVIPEPHRIGHDWFRDSANALQRHFILEYDLISSADAKLVLANLFGTNCTLNIVNPFSDTAQDFTCTTFSVIMGLERDTAEGRFYDGFKLVLLRSAP